MRSPLKNLGYARLLQSMRFFIGMRLTIADTVRYKNQQTEAVS